MQSWRQFMIPLLLFIVFVNSWFLVLAGTAIEEESGSSIYEVLNLYGLPAGLLPKGVKNYSLDNSGRFAVHLGRACNAKFEDEIHYDADVSGNISYGQIDGLSGIKAQDLFLWFPVIQIRVDVPSSGLIYFNVGVVSKQFSLSLFETPRDCLAVPGPGPDLLLHGARLFQRLFTQENSDIRLISIIHQEPDCKILREKYDAPLASITLRFFSGSCNV